MSYRYYKFTPTNLKNNGIANSVQISELLLLYNGVRVDYSTATATNPGGSTPSGETPSRCIDNNLNTKWLDFNKCSLIIDFGKNTLVNSYTFVTANDSPERDPISWQFYGSSDNINFDLLDTKNNYPTTDARLTYLPYFPLIINFSLITNFSIPTKTYGDSSFDIIDPSSNSTGVFIYTSSDTNVATINGNTVTIINAGTSTITASQTATTDFSATTVTTDFQVNIANPTITYFSIPTKTYGDSSFTIINPYSNSPGAFIYTSSDTNVATINGNTVTIINAGTCTITASQTATTDFSATTATAIFQVNKAISTISNFSIPIKTYGNIPFNIIDPSCNNTGAFSYTSSNSAVATVSGKTITIVGSGISTINAIKDETTNYTSAMVSNNFIVKENTSNNPAVILSSDELVYVLNTNARYMNINNDIILCNNFNLTSNSNKIIFNDKENIVNIKI